MSKHRMYRCFKRSSSSLGLYHVYAGGGRMLCKGEKKVGELELGRSFFWRIMYRACEKLT
ncbi:hypothetical protein KH172YL63_32800 [Bacillus sp. KH172YL63]|nr:hypothetical protein KH172YL63_32800 [Bacillus sp. KH172YL63]